MKGICVIGSINMDLVVRVERFPRPGETLTGRDFGAFPGGKGANQAVAAGRLGGVKVRMLGKVGDDIYGKQYLQVFKDAGVGTEGVGVEPGMSTGIAVIEVDSAGENHIVIVPGANGKVSQGFLNGKMDFPLEAGVFLFQLEIPLEAVAGAMKKVKAGSGLVMLDPAPARPLPDELLGLCDFITPNESEAGALTGKRPETERDFREAANSLLARGAGTVILKAGKNGCFVANRDGFSHHPGFKVDAVDTTAAGDTFNAAFAHAHVREKPLADCARFANAAAALKTMRPGAQAGMPTLPQVEEFLAAH